MPDLGAQVNARSPKRPAMEPISQSLKQTFSGGQSRQRDSSLPASARFESQLASSAKKTLLTHINFDAPIRTVVGKPSSNMILLNPFQNLDVNGKSPEKHKTGAIGEDEESEPIALSKPQALFHIPALFNYLMSDSHAKLCSRSGQCLLCNVTQTLKETLKASCIRPSRICGRLKLICKHMMQGRQEDAHEFLRYLIDALRNSYLQSVNASTLNLDSASRETTPFNQIFGGYFRQEVTCLKCKHVSTTFQHFMDILVDIRKVSDINEGVSAFFQLERIGSAKDPGSMYTCTKCKAKGIVTKKIYIDRAPVVLCIQLKRFSLMGGKIMKPIALAPKIDISPYVWPKHKQQDASSSPKPLEYKLVSMITHVGPSPNCGHYTAIGSASDGQFYKFDDSMVHPIKVQQALNTASYVVFYEMTKTTKSAWIDSNQKKANHVSPVCKLQRLQEPAGQDGGKPVANGHHRAANVVQAQLHFQACQAPAARPAAATLHYHAQRDEGGKSVMEHTAKAGAVPVHQQRVRPVGRVRCSGLLRRRLACRSRRRWRHASALTAASLARKAAAGAAPGNASASTSCSNAANRSWTSSTCATSTANKTLHDYLIA